MISWSSSSLKQQFYIIEDSDTADTIFFHKVIPLNFLLLLVFSFKSTYICPSSLEHIQLINSVLICVTCIMYTVPGDRHHDCQHEENNYLLHLSTSVLKNWYPVACPLTSSCCQSTFSFYHSAKNAHAPSAILLYKQLFFKWKFFLSKSSTLFLSLLILIFMILVYLSK